MIIKLFFSDHSGLSKDEIDMIVSTLELRDTKVEDIYVPIRDVLIYYRNFVGIYAIAR